MLWLAISVSSKMFANIQCLLSTSLLSPGSTVSHLKALNGVENCKYSDFSLWIYTDWFCSERDLQNDKIFLEFKILWQFTSLCTLSMFYKQLCDLATGWCISNPDGGCLTVAYFQKKFSYGGCLEGNAKKLTQLR